MNLTVRFERDAVTIQRTSNGWMVHTWTPPGHHSDATSCLAVAETPESLLALIGQWARAQAELRQ